MWNKDWVLPEVVPALRDEVDAACRAVGRDPATLERTVAVRMDLPGVERHPFGAFDGQISGPPGELGRHMRSDADAGIAHVQVLLGPTTLAGVEAFAPVLQLLDRG